MPGAAAKRHPIQVVSRRTGLSADVLRAWEKRYGILEPARSDGGRRLYSDDDIEYLRLLKRATAAGRNVGQLAALSRRELTALVREDEAAASAVPTPPGAAPVRTAVLERALGAMRQLDASTLEATLRRAMIESEAIQFLEGVVVPLLEQVGELWEKGELRPAHEHLASAVVRGVLGEFVGTFSAAADAPHILVATPTGQRHEFGAMLAAATAAAVGWRVTYLGAELPADEIAAAAKQAGVAAVGLSLVHPRGDAEVGEQLRHLRRALAADVVLLVGGSAAGSYQKTLRDVGATHVPDLPHLRTTLASVGRGTARRS